MARFEMTVFECDQCGAKETDQERMDDWLAVTIVPFATTDESRRQAFEVCSIGCATQFLADGTTITPVEVPPDQVDLILGRDHLARGKYTRWAGDITAEQVEGLLWVVGEFAGRTSSALAYQLEKTEGLYLHPRALLALRALIDFRSSPVTVDGWREILKRGYRGLKAVKRSFAVRPGAMYRGRVRSGRDRHVVVVRLRRRRTPPEAVLREVTRTGRPKRGAHQFTSVLTTDPETGAWRLRDGYTLVDTLGRSR